eukprot:313735-Alexandrium_andersonii.AAC.1
MLEASAKVCPQLCTHVDSNTSHTHTPTSAKGGTTLTRDSDKLLLTKWHSQGRSGERQIDR